MALILSVETAAFCASVAELCPGLAVESEEDLHFTDSELRLVCGDSTNPGWKTVPTSQALFHLRTFLEDRGYFATASQSFNGRTVLKSGEPALLTAIELEGAPPELSTWDAGSDLVGERLIPARLKEIVDAVAAKLGSKGYACSTLIPRADVTTGVVRIAIQSGLKQPLIEVREEPTQGFLAGSLRRYDAFVIGETFNQELLPLTARRTVVDGVVPNTYFNVRCSEKGVIANQKIVSGPPRQITLGAGFNTDRGLSTRAAWRHSRLGKQGSQLDASLSASYKGNLFNTQEGRVDGAWYFLSRPSRLFLRPLFSFKHQSDNRMDIVSGQVQLSPARTWDTSEHGGSVSLGLGLNGEYKLRGVGRQHAFYAALLFDLRLTSHDFEWYRSAPRTGYELLVDASASQRDVLGDFTADTLRLRVTRLWKIGANRRHFIAGLRTGLSTTVAPEDEGGLGLLIPALRQYLGGTTNLRGFGFQELPNATGGLTSFFASHEARAVGLLPYEVQPYLFLDFGMISTDTLAFTGPWFVSPGAGIRWQSPVGAIRSSVGHGYGFANADPALSHWQFHISFGEEF